MHRLVFHDDAQIVRFLNNLKEFSQYQGNWQAGDDDRPKIMQWKENKYLTGLVLLEKIFDRHDRFKQSKQATKHEDSIEI